jgi:hypothetical protein
LLDSGEVLRQLELLVLRAPRELRFVLATRHDLRLGLHRLRLAGELTGRVDLRTGPSGRRWLLRMICALPECPVSEHRDGRADIQLGRISDVPLPAFLAEFAA